MHSPTLALGDVGARVADIIRSRIEERCPARVADGRAALTLTLALDGEVAAEGFRIEDDGAGLRIVGGDGLGLFAGAGKFLRSSCYTASGFQPSAWRGVSRPQCRVRGMYLACHFHNWYQAAPAREVQRYVEDLALWGINAVGSTFPFINLNGWEDPEAERSLQQVRRLLRAAESLGLRTCLFVGNALFNNTPSALRATPVNDPLGRRGNSGAPVCPHDRAANAMLRDCYQRLFERLSDLHIDYLCVWPYDEGGCGCTRCAPWGANGFLKVARELAAVARTYSPAIEVILSTWMFDTPQEGEWEGLARALAASDHGISYLMADSHEDFPRYPLEAGVPGDLPLLNFPEISMWGLYPWGGFGATPLPARHERIWRQAGDHLAGGFAYSEGIYEDINKAVISQLYWDRQTTAASALREYIAYEYAPEMIALVRRMIALIESSHTRAARGEQARPEAVREALAVAHQVNAQLPAWARGGWRWRILFVRAVLDSERYVSGRLDTPAGDAALRELIGIFHARLTDDGTDPYHCRVRPPLTLTAMR
ncbi:MAG: hypothetical protein JSV65_11580 [Armatimonadota bacterium]|nr:MAG: hypothetical protein JSV65_11580 [Armatimonadota bacterium]